jgi:glycosyltransferase involved in cell wall biosynthesis
MPLGHSGKMLISELMSYINDYCGRDFRDILEMVNSTGYIVSLKFSPGLKKEFLLIGENLKAKGINIKYILSKEYEFLDNNLDSMVFLTKSTNLKEMLVDTFKFFSSKKINELFSEDNVKFILFYNNHILNRPLAKFLKIKFKNVITILYFHDPYKPDKSSYGLSKGLYISLAEFIVKRSLQFIDHVILASKYGYELFSKYYNNYWGGVHIAPLLVPSITLNNKHNREFFSIVGAYHSATGHDCFIRLVNYIAEKEGNYKFALITSSNISELLVNLSEAGKKIIKIVNRKIINDSEINQIIAGSYAIFRLDKEVTQSGVIPVSYMNGTPIIARDIPGLTQHVQHGHTGYIVPFQCNSIDLTHAMNHVINNFNHLSINARNNYEEIWAEHNFDKYYRWLLETINCQQN